MGFATISDDITLGGRRRQAVTRCRAGSGNSHHVGDCGGERRRAAMAGQTAGWGREGATRALAGAMQLQ
jgi:hypothetical protein